MGKKVGIEIEVDNKGAIKSFKQLGVAGGKSTDKIDKGSKDASDSMKGLNKVAIATTASFVGLGLVATKFAKDFISAGFETTKQAEKVQTQFKTILGSAEAAQERYAELAKFAASTPFQLNGVASASKILETLTQGALSSGEGLRTVGDAAAIAGVGFDELAIHVGRAYSGLQSNRPIGEALARLQELGLVTGETRNQIEKLQKQAKGNEAWEILQTALEKTKGGMNELSKTLEGKTSTLVDNIGLVAAALLDVTGATDAWKGAITDLTVVADLALKNLELQKIRQKEISELTKSEVETLKDATRAQLRNNKELERSNTLTKQQAQLLSAGVSKDAIKKQQDAANKALSDTIINLDIRLEKIKEANSKDLEEKKRLEIERLDVIRASEQEGLLILEESFDARNEITNMGLQGDLEAHNKSEKEKTQLLVERLLEEDRLKQEASIKDLLRAEKQAKSEQRISENTAKSERANIAKGAQIAANATAQIFNDSKIAASSKIGVSTAVATMRLYEDFPLPVAIGLTPFVVGAGVKQIAEVNRQKLADGGLVSGAGSSRSDSIPADLSNGEFVVNASATGDNREVLEAINKGGSAGGNNYNISVSVGIGANLDDVAQAVTNGIERANQLSLEPQI